MKAFAKINLFLDVLGKREDGYHNIFSVMQSVDLCDELIISTDNTDELHTPLHVRLEAVNSFQCDGNGGRVQLLCDNAKLPIDENNLIIKAAKALIRDFNSPQNLKIDLTKRIPLGAGLAGGSSDCAATLLGINKLLNLNIPFEKLLEIGKSLGADVPFCLTGGTAAVEGIGEKVTPLTPHPSCFFIISCPDIHVSTTEIFSKLGKIENFNRERQEKRQSIIDAIANKKFAQIAKSFYNVFTPITMGIHPEIFVLINEFLKLGALGAEMSGTGSSVFACFDNEKSAQKAFDRVKKITKNTFLCKDIKDLRCVAPKPSLLF